MRFNTCTKRGEKSFSAIGTFFIFPFFLMSRLSFQSVTMATAAIHVILSDHVLCFFYFLYKQVYVNQVGKRLHSH